MTVSPTFHFKSLRVIKLLVTSSSRAVTGRRPVAGFILYIVKRFWLQASTSVRLLLLSESALLLISPRSIDKPMAFTFFCFARVCTSLLFSSLYLACQAPS